MVHILAQIFEGTCGSLIDPTTFVSKMFFLGTKETLHSPCLVIFFFCLGGGGKRGPLIDTIKKILWTTD